MADLTEGTIPKASGASVLVDGYTVATEVGDPGADDQLVSEQGIREALSGSSWDGDIADIDLDGGSDLGAALADADLILVDDGGAGTNRKCALTRIPTYVESKTKLDDLQTPDDNTDLDATTTEHGLLPKLDGDAHHHLDGEGNWSPTVEWKSFVIDGGGSAIETGEKGHFVVPAGEIVEVVLLAGQSGDIKVDLWKDTYGNFPPTDADSICGGNEPEISSGNKDRDTTLSGWTTSLSDGDVIAVNVDSVDTIERCTVALKIEK
ncbi:MAG: hypothetical protein ACOC7S_00860 [Planctomycetota bacterium]